MFCCLFTNEQIVEEVQKFYSSSIADVSNSNGTAVAFLYHKTVSKTLCLRSVASFICQRHNFILLCFLLFQLNCCGGSTSDTSDTLCAEAEDAQVNYDTLHPRGGSVAQFQDGKSCWNLVPHQSCVTDPFSCQIVVSRLTYSVCN